MEFEMQRRLKCGEHVWIYGAGKIGEHAARLYKNPVFGLSIDGIVVSDRQGNPDTLGGFAVKDIQDVETEDKSSVFIIAVSEKYQRRIIETLAERGYHNYVPWNGIPAGHLWTLADHRLEDRSKGQDKVCLILSGYKEFLWDNVFTRVKRFVPQDVHVCILSSGTHSGKLAGIAEENEWSYLSTALNDVTLIQNIAIGLFGRAEWIYKMDEDMFLTEGCFERMFRMYHYVLERGRYRPGFVAPLIPLNGYGHIRILELIGELEAYENRFGKAVYGGFKESRLECDPDAAAFLWGYESGLPRLDELNQMLEKHSTFSVCGVRFSIGLIMFHRSLWEDMKGFPVFGKPDLGADEVEICRYCIQHSRGIIIAENTVAGHFSFGKQTEGMRKIYEERRDLFELMEEDGGT